MTPPESTVIRTDIDAMLADRYGRTSSPRRLLGWITLGVAAAAVLGYITWATIAQNIDSVDYDTVRYTTVDEHSVSVTFQVVTQHESPLACVIEAQDEDHGVVGWRVVEYAADPAHTRTFTETVPTTALATTGLVTSCWIP
jgi:hypothetical protein